MKSILLVFCMAALCSAPCGKMFAATHDWAAEPLKESKLNTVAFRGWIPDTSKPLAGALVLIPGRHGDGRGMADDPQWQQLATDLDFAILACQFSDGEPFIYQSDAHGEVAKCINTAVDHLSELSGRVELKKAPLAFWGLSAGSNVSSRYCVFFPERVAAFASSTGTCGPGGEINAKNLDIPMFFAIGGTDKPDWVKGSLDNAQRGQGKAPWTVALQKTQGHGIGKSMDVIVPFLQATVKQRLGTAAPAPGTTSIFKSELPNIGSSSRPAAGTAKALKKLNLQAGWLGNPTTYDIAPYAGYKGSKSQAIWLPDEATAQAWQAYLLAP
ncbi:MAG: hypothetical protein NTV93_11865 [Verrucomicrobia bacterium]|nr:hypothetical protein [Verrucomicrobiota bacterium]